MADGAKVTTLSTPTKRKRLGEMLLDLALISAEQLESALAHQKAHGGRLGSVLVTLGFLSEEELESNLGRQLGLAITEVESVDPPANVLRLVPERLMRRHELVPLSFDNRTLVVGMTDPFNSAALEELRFLGFPKVEPRLITETTLRRFLSTRYAAAMLMDQVLNDGDLQRMARTQGGRPDDDANLPPIIRLTNYILEQAVESRASDIHVEPYESFFRVRFRVDGSMHTVLTPPLRLHSGLSSRIKILCGLDIAERRKPQDGHMAMDIGQENLHFRVSVLPTVYGEKVCIRLLKKEAHLADMGRLGFSSTQLATLRRVSALPQGLILVTGPTGSGKTTSLHAVLNHLNEPDVNIVTIEDPVEASIAGINHVAVQDKGGVSFSSALRSILRQDPDVVFVGEMRDKEVSEIAVRASLTGHLVLSTLHTNGTVETFARLADMGLESYLLASCLKLVVAQRLVRRLCSKCARTEPIPAGIVEGFKLSVEQVAAARYRVGVGCRNCMHTGYRGRMAVYEMLEPNDEIKTVMRANGGEEALMVAAQRSGMAWLWDSGVAAALAGETTFDEIRQSLGTA